MFKILDNIYIRVFLAGSQSASFLVFIKYTLSQLHSHCTPKRVLVLFCRMHKLLFCDEKFFQNIPIIIHLFCPKTGRTGCRKTSIFLDWLLVGSCPTSGGITFLLITLSICVLCILSYQ